MALFIEEPEMTMHPSIQRILIETLLAQFSDLQIFLTTHSNHFLDLTYDYPEDISIFSFENIDDGKFNISEVTGKSKILDLLGIRNSSVFLANSVIWTEGVTDRMLLRKLIELVDWDYKEDYHYTFAEYGGNNLENFDFLSLESAEKVNVESLTKTNFIVVDNDGVMVPPKTEAGKSKYDRRKKVEKLVGVDNFFDGHIEIENLIPYRVWRKVVERIIEDKPKKNLKLKVEKAKTEADFNEGLAHKKIGDLLKKHIIESSEKNGVGYLKRKDIQCLGESKKTIMQYVLVEIDEQNLSLDNFPLEAQRLIRSIGKFIEISNKR
jgi:predicted ATP-dependent endonuclease of OLD family